jgi:tetratricopeptide (TPR) repeat protein
LLAAIWGLALLLRGLYIWQISHAPFFDLRLGDAAAYDSWARSIAAGDWLGQGVFYQAPLYPYFLALIYRVLDDSVTTVRIVQAVLGAFSCVLLARAGILWFGRWGAVAGALLAIYPPAIFLDGSLEKSALVTFLMCWLLALLADRNWQPAGAVLGLLALGRENALILAVPIVCWIVWEHRKRREALLFAAACALVLLPVAVRNLAVGGELHLTTAQFGPNFYIGNHDGARGTYEALVIGHGSVSDEREDATRLAEQAAGRRLSAGEVSSYWTGRALKFIGSHPGTWLALIARKLALALNVSEVTDTESQSVYAEWSWILKLPFHFGLLLGLAAMGAVLAWEERRRIALLHGMAAAYVLGVALFYVFGRYRFPVVPVLMLVATAGVDHLRRGKRLAIAAAAGVVALAFAYLPLDDARTARAITYHSMATALAEDPERAYEALGFYQTALATDPKYPAAQVGLATLLSRMDRQTEAIPYFRSALASWPDYAEAHYNLGVTLAALGQVDEAAAELDRALRLRPDDPETLLASAKVLLTLNRPKEAADLYERAVAARPADAAAMVGWGISLAQSGYADEAIRKYQAALLLDPRSASAHSNMGSTLAAIGRTEEAKRHFERALEIDPQYESAQKNLELINRMSKKH